MREDSFTYKFETGLRAKGQSPRNSIGLELCHNLKPDNGRLKAVTDINTPSGASWTSVDDQLFCCQEVNLLGCNQLLYTLDSSMDVLSILPTTAITVPWSVADFGAYVVLTNGNKIHVYANNHVSAYTGSNIPVCRSICNFRGQLVAGSPSGYDSNVVLWGDIGRTTMTLTDTVTAGYMPLPSQGYVHDVRTLGGYVAAYGSNGVDLLRPLSSSPPGFGLVPVSSVGLLSAGAVGGDAIKQLFVRSDGRLCLIETDPVKPVAFQIKILDYKEWFEDWTEARVSYDPGEDEFYITNGAECYILTSEGLCSTHYLVVSCQRYYGTLWGMRALASDTDAYVMTQAFDGGQRGRKDIEALEIGGSDGWYTTIYWRNTGSAAWRQGSVVVTNPMGAARNKVSGEEFKLYLKANSASASLDYANVRWKRTDRRFVRGMDAGQAAARSGQ